MIRALDVATSLAATLARAASGSSVGALGKRPAQPLDLYEFEACPFCRKVREALGLAIDKQAILDSVYLGEVGTAAGSVIPPRLLGHDPSIPPVPYDPEKAKKLLAEAGHPNGFKTDLWAMPVVRAYMPNARRAAELIQADWAKIGVEAKIVSMEWGEYLQATKDGEHETVILGLNYDYPGPESSAIWGWSCASAKIGWNRARWCNKEWDDLMYAAQSESDSKKRAELIIEASRIFVLVSMLSLDTVSTMH